MNAHSPLVSVEELRAHLADEDLRVIDLRWYLKGRVGADEYARGHIPGAVFIDLQTELTAPSGPGRHPIPSAAQMELAMRNAGVSARSNVVVYDDAGGSVAARLWWLLTQFDHPAVRVLDGGLPAWLAAGGASLTTAPKVAPGDWKPLRSVRSSIDRHRLDALLRASPPAVVLDARAGERYRGEVEPIDARPGHIPGALSAPFSENLGADGRFLSPEILRARFEALGVRDEKTLTVCYCGSGVTACHDILALSLGGLGEALLYEGSWSEWAKDPFRPAILGADPYGLTIASE